MSTTHDNHRISTYAEYEKKMSSYTQKLKRMIQNPDKPIYPRLIMLSGDKGVGKSFMAKKILENQNVREFVRVPGSSSPVGLYQELWKHNNAIILLDDLDKLITDRKDGSAILKAATDSYDVRMLSWLKNNPKCVKIPDSITDNDTIADKIASTANSNPKLKEAYERGELFPSKFYFTGALIILTNKPLSKVDDASDGALSNRAWHMEMLFNLDGALDLIKNSVDKVPNVDEQYVKQAIELLTSEQVVKYCRGTGKIPTLRNLEKFAREFEEGNTIDQITLEANLEWPAY